MMGPCVEEIDIQQGIDALNELYKCIIRRWDK